MANTYFNTIDVDSPQEASILSNEYTWTILEVLHKSGSKGLVPKEVHELVEKEEGGSVSTSKIYDILRRLYEFEWVHRYYDKKAKANRSTLSIPWGDVGLDEEFSDLVHNKMERYIKKEFVPVFLDYFKEAINQFSSDSKIKKWIPDSGKTSFCIKCKANHEADEFFHGLLLGALSIFYESDEFENFLKKQKYVDEDYKI